MNSGLSINRPNTTIAGQTAPGDGICIADHPVSLNANNVIVRYIRFRLGDKNQNLGMVNGSGDGDAFSGTTYKNIMIDHCTMSWSSDETFSIYRGDSTTLQWNLLSEPLDYSYHFETGDTDFERHGYGGIWGGRRSSFHHNLIAHVRGRAPRFDGSRNLPNSTTPVVGSENADFRNNVIYNWIDYNVNGGEGGNYNVVNNFYKYGPSTLTNSTAGVSRRSMVINPSKQTSPALPYGKYFLTGNYVDSLPAIPSFVTNNNWRGAAMNAGSLADTNQSKVEVPFDIAPLNTQSALDAYNSVLANAGVTIPRRDTLDERIVNDVKNRTGRIIDVQGGYPHGTPYAQTTNAWPTLNSTPAPTDTDRDGMPDTWETANGGNPTDASDRNTYQPNGYTLLENYLNNIAATPLPLNLLSFKAMVVGKQVQTNWVAANEVNTKSFAVERSEDGRDFSAIGSEVAKNTPGDNHYSFTDRTPLNNVSFYRLKMVDKDGSLTYSFVQKVNLQKKAALIINPNPATDRMVVSHPLAVKNATIQMINSDGKKMGTYKVNSGAVQSNIVVAGYIPGVYYLLFNNGAESMISQFVKK